MLRTDDQAHRFGRWPVVVLVIATLAVYGRLAGADFSCWDDWINIQRNPRVNPPTLENFKYYWSQAEYGLYVPVTYSVWMGLALVARVNAPDQNGATLNPWIFHSANLLVHVSAAVFTYLLLLRLTRRSIPALFGAMLWSLHPVQVETVAWISGMKDLLAGCFAIAALWRYVARVQDSDGKARWPGVTATIAMILALLSKPSAIVTPALALTIDWLILDRPFKVALRTSAIWFVIALPFAVIARLVQDVDFMRPVPILARPFIAGDTLCFYLGKLFFPLHLTIDYVRRPWDLIKQPAFKFTWMGSVAAIVIVVLLRRRVRWLAPAGLLFVLPIIPVSGLMMFQYQYHSTTSDHYLYLPMLGAAVAAAFLLRNCASRTATVLAGIVILTLAVRSLLQAGVWDNDLTLFTHAIAIKPNSFDGHNNLANAYVTRGNGQGAIDEFRKSIEVNPEYFLAYENLAHMLAGQGDYEQAIDVMEKSLEVRQHVPGALNEKAVQDHVMTAQMLARRGRFDEARVHFAAAIGLEKDPALANKWRAVERTDVDEAQIKNRAASTTRASTQAVDRR